MSRLDGAVTSIRHAVATAADIPLDGIDGDDDFLDDLGLCPIELESFSLIVEELYGITVPEEIFATPLYRTPASFAEWVIRQAEQAAWERKRA